MMVTRVRTIKQINCRFWAVDSFKFFSYNNKNNYSEMISFLDFFILHSKRVLMFFRTAHQRISAQRILSSSQPRGIKVKKLANHKYVARVRLHDPHPPTRATKNHPIRQNEFSFSIVLKVNVL